MSRRNGEAALGIKGTRGEPGEAEVDGLDLGVITLSKGGTCDVAPFGVGPGGPGKAAGVVLEGGATGALDGGVTGLATFTTIAAPPGLAAPLGVQASLASFGLAESLGLAASLSVAAPVGLKASLIMASLGVTTDAWASPGAGAAADGAGIGDTTAAKREGALCGPDVRQRSARAEFGPTTETVVPGTVAILGEDTRCDGVDTSARVSAGGPGGDVGAAVARREPSTANVGTSGQLAAAAYRESAVAATAAVRGMRPAAVRGMRPATPERVANGGWTAASWGAAAGEGAASATCTRACGLAPSPAAAFATGGGGWTAAGATWLALGGCRPAAIGAACAAAFGCCCDTATAAAAAAAAGSVPLASRSSGVLPGQADGGTVAGDEVGGFAGMDAGAAALGAAIPSAAAVAVGGVTSNSGAFTAAAPDAAVLAALAASAAGLELRRVRMLARAEWERARRSRVSAAAISR